MVAFVDFYKKVVDNKSNWQYDKQNDGSIKGRREKKMGRKKKESLTRFHRDNIVQSARKLFETKGIEKTTVDDIAKEADYSKSTLYVYFKSKDEILQTILLEQMQLLLEILQRNNEEGKAFKESYFTLCAEMVAYERNYPLYFALMLEKIELPKEEGQEENVLYQIYEMGEKLNDEVAILLKRGQKEGVVKKDLNLIFTSMFFWSGLSEIIRFSGQKEDYFKKRMKMEREDYMEYGFELLLRSILA